MPFEFLPGAMAEEEDDRDSIHGSSPDDGATESVATDTSVAGSPGAGTGEDASDDDENWEYAVDEFPTDPSATDPGAEQEAAEDGESGGNVAGEMFDLEEEIEPGSPSPESTVFVVLGVLVTVLFFLSAAGLI